MTESDPQSPLGGDSFVGRTRTSTGHPAGAQTPVLPTPPLKPWLSPPLLGGALRAGLCLLAPPASPAHAAGGVFLSEDGPSQLQCLPSFGA